MTNPYRAMCAELLEWAERTSSHYYKQADVIVRARALLDQQEQKGPTDKELMAVFWEHENGLEELWAADWPTAARAALAKYGSTTPQPVAVSERLPGAEDCTAQGWCWVFYRGFATWTLEKPLGQDGKHTGYTHWLPANALPTPEAKQ